MGLARKLPRNTSSPIFRPVEPPVVTSLFSFFDGTDNFGAIPTVTSSAGASVSFQIATTATSLQTVLENIYTVNADGSTSLPAGASATSFTRNGNLTTVTVTGIPAGVACSAIGRQGLTNYWFGPIRNVRFLSGWTQGGVANANPFYRVDDADNVLRNSGSTGPAGNGQYNNFQAGDKHSYTLSNDGTQWDQDAPVNASLPNPLEVA